MFRESWISKPMSHPYPSVHIVQIQQFHYCLQPFQCNYSVQHIRPEVYFYTCASNTPTDLRPTLGQKSTHLPSSGFHRTNRSLRTRLTHTKQGSIPVSDHCSGIYTPTELPSWPGSARTNNIIVRSSASHATRFPVTLRTGRYFTVVSSAPLKSVVTSGAFISR